MTCLTSLSGRNRTVLIAGILTIAATLRVTSTGAAPPLDMIHSVHLLTTAQTGLLTTLPLLALALISPLAAPVARRLGMEHSLFAALLLIYAGITIRSLPSPYLLFGGTVAIGGGIALGSVSLPGLIKRNFSHSVARLIGVYSLTMGATATLGSAMVVPLALNGLDWQGALFMLMCLPLLALFLWLPQWRSQQHASLSTSRALHTRGIWCSPFARQVTLFLGINPLVYYVTIGWFPAIPTSRGYSGAQAGSLHSLLQLTIAAPGLLIPLFLHHVKDQRGIVAFAALMRAVGAVGLCLMPTHVITWIPPFGFGSGVTMILGLTFIDLRASFAHQAATLSGMAQSVGHLPTACGPPLMGKIHDVNGDWPVLLMGVAIPLLLMAIFGLCTGRGKEIRQYPVLQ